MHVHDHRRIDQRYVTPELCRVASIGTVPCATYIVNATDGRPLQTSNSYANGLYVQMTYVSLLVGQPNASAFELPKNWNQLYRNYNNAFRIQHTGADNPVVSPGTPLKITISLRTVPQVGLGIVSASPYTVIDKNSNCTTCIKV